MPGHPEKIPASKWSSETCKLALATHKRDVIGRNKKRHSHVSASYARFVSLEAARCAFFFFALEP